MKTVSGKIISTKSVSLSKAANILSNFVTSDNGASQPVGVYLRRASEAFNELVYFKKHLRSKKHSSKDDASTKSDVSHRSFEEHRTEEVEGKLRKKEKKRKKTEASLLSGENDKPAVEVKDGNETMSVKNEEKKKKKKRKNAVVDGGETSNSVTHERKKRRRTEADD
ncbi:hypothetical protein M8C21_028678 [Ambrosia artemisiifolia]|uniref:Uncharacterized protein n=1 Tax=Ambrosia artemisiifolia TaxID=4212 RepID=A0AAD5BUZ3_AMBAR|nr:hypothetical protein M8C21_028678 [Ambrosia artemisiifolia]